MKHHEAQTNFLGELEVPAHVHCLGWGLIQGTGYIGRTGLTMKTTSLASQDGFLDGQTARLCLKEGTLKLGYIGYISIK